MGGTSPSFPTFLSQVVIPQDPYEFYVVIQVWVPFQPLNLSYQHLKSFQERVSLQSPFSSKVMASFLPLVLSFLLRPQTSIACGLILSSPFSPLAIQQSIVISQLMVCEIFNFIQVHQYVKPQHEVHQLPWGVPHAQGQAMVWGLLLPYVQHDVILPPSLIQYLIAVTIQFFIWSQRKISFQFPPFITFWRSLPQQVEKPFLPMQVYSFELI